MTDNLHSLRAVPTTRGRTRWWAPALAAAGLLVLAGCGSSTGGTAGPATTATAAAAGTSAAEGDDFVPSPDIPFPCSLFSDDEIAAFIGDATLDEVVREDTGPLAVGCVWTSADESQVVTFSKQVSDRVLDGVLEGGTSVDELGDRAAYIEEDVEIDDDTTGIKRTLVAASGDNRVLLTVRATDPNLNDMTALVAVVQARLAASTSAVDQNGDAQLGADLQLCQDVIAGWHRNYAVLDGTASVVSSVGEYTSGLVDFAVEKAPTLTNPDLRTAFDNLAAAGPADPDDPSAAEVEAVRVAVVEIGEACATGGVEIDWLPN